MFFSSDRSSRRGNIVRASQQASKEECLREHVREKSTKEIKHLEEEEGEPCPYGLGSF